MKVKLTERDLKTLKLEDSGWVYSIRTRTGNVTGSCLPDKETAIAHAEKQLETILKSMLKR